MKPDRDWMEDALESRPSVINPDSVAVESALASLPCSAKSTISVETSSSCWKFSPFSSATTGTNFCLVSTRVSLRPGVGCAGGTSLSIISSNCFCLAETDPGGVCHTDPDGLRKGCCASPNSRFWGPLDGAMSSDPSSLPPSGYSSSARASSPSGSSGTAATCASSSSIAIAPHSAWPCTMDDARESRPSAKNPSSPTEDARDSLPPIMKSVMPVSASSSSSSSS